MAEAAISLHEVSKRFRLPSSRRQSFKERAVRGKAEDTYFWALRDATFDIPRGSTFGVIGPNGSGKSTALKVMDVLVRQVREHATSVVLVTHSETAAARADRVLHLTADGIRV